MPKRDITANELRALAEAADGARGQRLQLVWDDNHRGPNGSTGGLRLEASAGSPSSNGSHELTLNTRDESGAMTNVEVSVTTPVGAIQPVQVEGDALFWSAAAIDKFVVPYYSRFKSLTEVANIRSALLDKTDVFAALHVRPSIMRQVVGDSTPVAESLAIRESMAKYPGIRLLTVDAVT